MSRIVSSLPGRIRIRDRVLRNQRRLNQLEAELIQIEGITSLQSNPGAGSIILYFDAAQSDAEMMEAAVDAAVDNALATPLPAVDRSVKMRVNRYAKAGMLGSLATSLALAATGQKRLHAVTGGIFVACLGVHLSTHHRSLLR
ncbi:HMA2 domain-containing protein [Methylobacter sp.]|uniref:HMA2 domain-containing protein n=1 Tax=Methylobacter sp. TaxID=2051955 RepID=UPI002FDD569B